ncbi:UNVERIFIED_CONTAM: hypothetical protein Sangu_2865000 [Sesamum angustifolium]|uniref:Zinc finger PHD-type domain-containing protein n=1 Tax=Sesamum angustifolium TaxID=2727405 RepID=A0AAW2INF7_9LAMI
MDSGEIVVSSIRAGMKREFAMMMKAQSKIGALPAGRRRMTRSQSTAGSSKGNVRVLTRGTDGDSIQEAERPVGETSDSGMKMSEKVELNWIPTKLKDLLQTGLLEGLQVRYIHGSKGRSRPESELRGVIQGAGILCSCDECKERKELIPEAGAGRSMLLCDACVLQKESDASDAQIVTPAAAQFLSMFGTVLAPQIYTGIAHLCTVSVAGPSAPLPLVARLWFQKMLKFLQIVNHKQNVKEANTKVSPSQFEAHAGYASRRKPMRRSLSYSQGIWYCKYCQNMFEKEKFAEPDANAIAAGRVPGVDPLEAITQRCIRVVATLEPEIGGCALCRRHDFCKTGFSARTIIICDQCEKEYHVGCLKEHNIDDLKELPEEDWFCCTPCKNINSALQKLIGDGEQRLPEALSDVVNLKSEGQDLHKNPELGIRWRLLHGKKATEDSRVWLSGAVNIFHDCFDPISVPAWAVLTSSTYGLWEELQRPGFLWHVLCCIDGGSVVVSAAIFRIFGEEVAELPLVATRSECQGKGYFQSLFYCVEGLLASLNVKDLVLPAADEAESLWRNRFGFQTLGQEQVAQCLPSTLRAFYRCN